MAAYDLEQQEQLATLKAWWAKYGNLFSSVITGVLVVLAGWFFWQRYQASQQEKASALYSEVFRAAGKEDVAKTRQLADQLVKDYPDTLQASLSALIAAKLDTDKKDLKNARIKLQWVAEHAPSALLKDTARLRWVPMLLDEKSHDEALKQISSVTTPEFAARFAEMRGDVLIEQNKADDARAAYQQAVDKLGDAQENAMLKNVIRTKLEALGGGK